MRIKLFHQITVRSFYSYETLIKLIFEWLFFHPEYTPGQDKWWNSYNNFIIGHLIVMFWLRFCVNQIKTLYFVGIEINEQNYWAMVQRSVEGFIPQVLKSKQTNRENKIKKKFNFQNIVHLPYDVWTINVMWV